MHEAGFCSLLHLLDFLLWSPNCCKVGTLAPSGGFTRSDTVLLPATFKHPHSSWREMLWLVPRCLHFLLTYCVKFGFIVIMNLLLTSCFSGRAFNPNVRLSVWHLAFIIISVWLKREQTVESPKNCTDVSKQANVSELQMIPGTLMN